MHSVAIGMAGVRGPSVLGAGREDRVEDGDDLGHLVLELVLTDVFESFFAPPGCHLVWPTAA